MSVRPITPKAKLALELMDFVHVVVGGGMTPNPRGVTSQKWRSECSFSSLHGVQALPAA